MTTYDEALERTRANAARLDDDGRRALAERFEGLFGTFTPEGVRESAPDTYAEDAWFNDTLKTAEGIEAVTDYLAHSASLCERCVVEVQHSAGSDIDTYLRWRMGIEFTKFRKGEMNWSIGMTHVRVNEAGEIILHQDYWDAAQGFFQYVPLLGAGIRAILRRL